MLFQPFSIITDFKTYPIETNTWLCKLVHKIIISRTYVVSVLASSVVDRGFKPRSCQSKDYKCGMRFFSARNIKEKEERLVSSESSEWNDMSTNPTKHAVLVQSGY